MMTVTHFSETPSKNIHQTPKNDSIRSTPHHPSSHKPFLMKTLHEHLWLIHFPPIAQVKYACQDKNAFGLICEEKHVLRYHWFSPPLRWLTFWLVQSIMDVSWCVPVLGRLRDFHVDIFNGQFQLDEAGKLKWLKTLKVVIIQNIPKTSRSFIVRMTIFESW